jgi:hypothetical protein
MHNQDEEVHAGVFTNPAIPPQYRGLFVTPAARVETISDNGGFPVDQPRRRFRPHR